MSTGFLYPGQGSQTSKMLEDVPASYFHRLEQATGFDLHPVSGVSNKIPSLFSWPF